MMIGRRRRRNTGHEADGSELQWPGASRKLELFAQVVWVGVLTFVAGLAIITLPAALAAGTRHLHRYLRAEESTVRRYSGDFLRALPGGLLVGAAAAALVVFLGLNIFLAGTQVLPGWPVILGLGIVGLALSVLTVLQAAFHWTPERGWRVAVADGVRALRTDLTGGFFILLAVALTVVVTWHLPPLVVAGLGCLMFTVLIVNVRQRST